MDDIASVRQRLESNHGNLVSGVHQSSRPASLDRISPILSDANAAVQQLLEAAFEAGRLDGIVEGHNVMRAKLRSLLELDSGRHSEFQRNPLHGDYDRAPQIDSAIVPAENERVVQWTTRLPS